MTGRYLKAPRLARMQSFLLRASYRSMARVTALRMTDCLERRIRKPWDFFFTCSHGVSVSMIACVREWVGHRSNCKYSADCLDNVLECS